MNYSAGTALQMRSAEVAAAPFLPSKTQASLVHEARTFICGLLKAELQVFPSILHLSFFFLDFLFFFLFPLFFLFFLSFLLPFFFLPFLARSSLIKLSIRAEVPSSNPSSQAKRQTAV